MKKVVFFLLVFAAMMLLGACAAPAGDTSLPLPTDSRAADSSTPSPPAATFTPEPPKEVPSPTLDDKSFWATWLASRPRDMESYGMVYDPAATPELPPRSSVNMPIWGNHLPLQVLAHTPLFVDTIPLQAAPDPAGALAHAQCTPSAGLLECSAASPLLGFGCEWLAAPHGSYPALPAGQQVTAICLKPPLDENESRESYLYRTGCAFRRDAGLILEKDGEFSLVDTPAQVKAMLLPIDSPEKALTYLEMMTGLSATYSFKADPMLLYFIDPLEGTHVESTDGVYSVNLYQYAHCLCEPWVDSQVNLQVDREGSITWLDALPISMTIGFSCAD